MKRKKAQDNAYARQEAKMHGLMKLTTEHIKSLEDRLLFLQSRMTKAGKNINEKEKELFKKFNPTRHELDIAIHRFTSRQDATDNAVTRMDEFVEFYKKESDEDIEERKTDHDKLARV